MKICLINNLYKPFNRGGAEKVSETIVSGLKQAGHEVFLITSKPCGKLPAGPEQQPIYYINSLYYNLNKLPKFLRLFWQIWNMFNFVSYFKIKKILRAEKCDAIITNNLMGVGFLTPLAIRNLKIKHLHIAHDIQLIHPSGLMYYGKEGIINNFFAKIYSSICRNLFGSPQAIVFPSRWLKNLYIKRNFFTQSKIEIMPNPVEIAPGQASERLGNFTFLFLGQIEKHKGVFLLIDAFNKIKEKYPKVELILAGDGSQIKAARKKAVGNNNIKFLGWPGDEAVDKLLFSNDCLVYPSLAYENCPNAIQRALAAGLPVLASDIGGISELLTDEAGMLFKPADDIDLVEKMVWTIENKNSLSNLTQAGRRKSVIFRVESYIKKLEEMIKL
ncbi:MAG: glycosyltransferase family 4 protein [bacterium]|nr:glycosyltransferase family 4 protein [bacterium]